MINRDISAAMLRFLVVLFALHFAARANAEVSSAFGGLLLYPKATMISNEKRNQLSYHVKESFPASGVIGWIAYNLQERGFVPLVHDALAGNTNTSQVHGWREFWDDRSTPAVCTPQWLGDWTSPTGNFVRYVFTYRNPTCDTSGLSDLEVAAVVMSSSAVQQLKTSSRPK